MSSFNARAWEKWAGRIFLGCELIAVPAFLLYCLATTLTTPPPAPVQAKPAPPPPAQPARVEMPVVLKRGNFTLFRYLPGDPQFAAHPKAIILFGSGDGGLDGWEDRVCKALQSDGYDMVAFDCNKYAATDYDIDILQADIATIAQKARSQYADPAPPLILGGWSMGAEQAVPAAGGPHPPPGLVGLLLISPGGRGRYGLRTADRWNVTPTGPGTFALEDFAHNLGHLRVAQWNGSLDLIGSKAWLDSLTAPHQSYAFTFGLHDYDGASDTFLSALKPSIAWILSTGN